MTGGKEKVDIDLGAVKIDVATDVGVGKNLDVVSHDDTQNIAGKGRSGKSWADSTLDEEVTDGGVRCWRVS